MDDMKSRFALYGFGFFIGLVLVFFFLGGKKASCNWLPNDRILNIIAQKKISFSDQVQESIAAGNADSLEIMQVLQHGDIDFSKSRVKNDPCRNYLIEQVQEQKELVITVEVCDSVAVVQTLSVQSR